LSTTRKVKARAQKLASEKEAAEKGKATPPPSSTEAMDIDSVPIFFFLKATPMIDR